MPNLGLKPAPEGKIAVYCVAKWSAGPNGKFTCTKFQPANDKRTVELTKDSLELDKICVNDLRLRSYGFNGTETATFEASGNPPARCAELKGVKRLPDTCNCEPPQGGSCDGPPADGFSCIVAGYITPPPDAK